MGGLLLLLLFLLGLGLEGAWASSFVGGKPTGANPGYVGLWEYPTAEMPDDGTGRFGATYASPYSFYYVDLAWLPWLEINTRLSTFDNVHVSWTGAINNKGIGRRYMDKAIDLKLMLHHSDLWYIPSLAVGVTDIMGTELMKAWYGVATWRRDRLALTLGYGTDRMNGLFGGVTWDVFDWLTLKAEYSPMDYSQDQASGHKPHPGQPKKKYNVGVVFRAPWGMEGSVSWQRGEEWVFSLSQRFDLAGPYLFGEAPNSLQKHYGQPGGARAAQWGDVPPDVLGARIQEALSEFVRVRDVELGITDRKVVLAYENYGHSSHAEAMVRVLVVLSSLLPHLDSVVLVPSLRGIPVVAAEFPGELLFALRSRDLDSKEPLRAAIFVWADGDLFERLVPQNSRWLYHSKGFMSKRGRHTLKAMPVYEPRIDRTLDDDYQDRWSLDLIYEGRYSNGWAAFADVRFPLRNEVEIPWEPNMSDQIRIHQAVVSYLRSLKGQDETGLWLLGEAGWLGDQDFGLNLWGRLYSKDGRWWVGARLGVFRDRDPWSFAGLAEGQFRYALLSFDDKTADPWRRVAWLQAGYDVPGLNLDLQVSYGRFADSDTGARVSAVRRWDDTEVGFWLTRTDRLTPGKDFTNAGVTLSLPAEKWLGSWFGRSSAHSWEQEFTLLSTWRTDAGREPVAWRSPERLLGQLRPVALRKNVELLLTDYCSYDPASARTTSVRGLSDYLLKKD